MLKRKREKDESEPAEGAKRKRAKEHSKSTPKAAGEQAITEAAPESPEDVLLPPSVENSSKALKRREAKRLKKEREHAGELDDRERVNPNPVKTIVKTSESTLNVPDADPSNKAFERQEARKRRKAKRQAEKSEDQGAGRLSAEKAVGKSSSKSKVRKGTREKDQKDKSPTWKVSDAAGGQMLDLDPLFSQNEE